MEVVATEDAVNGDSLGKQPAELDPRLVQVLQKQLEIIQQRRKRLLVDVEAVEQVFSTSFASVTDAF